LSLELDDLGKLLDRNEVTCHVRPLSILAIKSIMAHTCLIRTPNNSNLKPAPTAFHHEETLQKIFSKHVKPKKLYEIQAIAQETAGLASQCGVKWVFDVGSGLGHLSRLLAYGYDIKVIGLETQAVLVDKARLVSAYRKCSTKLRKKPWTGLVGAYQKPDLALFC